MGRVRLTLEVTAPRIYMRRVELAVYNALDEAVSNTLAYGERYAKRKAPVRKVTRRGSKARVRDLTPEEISALPEFARKGLSPISGASIRTGRLPQTTVRRAGASRLIPTAQIRGRTYKLGGEKGRDVTFDSGQPAMKNPRFAELLSARGNYELRTQRGIATQKLTAMIGGVIRHGERDTLGGRLRNEITSRMVSFATRGGISEGRLESPTEYAKYVEYPTSRTAAQPYMRPAREAMKTVLDRNVALELSRIGGRVL
jgi:hypothetical protein